MASIVRTIQGVDFVLDVWTCQKDPHPTAVDNVIVEPGEEYVAIRALQTETLRAVYAILRGPYEHTDYTPLLETISGSTDFVTLLRLFSEWGVTVDLSWQITEEFRNNYVVVGRQAGEKDGEFRTIVIVLSRVAPYRRIIFDVPLSLFAETKVNIDKGSYSDIDFDHFTIDQAQKILEDNGIQFVLSYGFQGKLEAWPTGMSIR